MIRSTLLTFAVVGLASTASAQFFTAGNVVVLRAGDPTLTLGTSAAPVYLEEWDTTTNSLVQTVEIPNSLTAATPSFSQRGFSSSEGQLNLSSDGRYLLVAGYDRMIGDTDPSAEQAATSPRVIARIDVLTGLIDTTTALTDAYDGNTIRGVASDDGSRFWTSGNSSNGSLRYVANLGDTTSIDINAGSPSNLRWIGIFDCDLFVTSASTGALAQGILAVGPGGLPTTGGQSLMLLPGFPTSGVFADGAPYDFFFADPDTVYTADSASNGTASFNCAGGIQKWEQSGGTWTMTYEINAPGMADCVRGLTGLVRNGQTELWFTAEPNGFTTALYSVVDTGAGSVPTLIAQEPAESDYRGLRIIGSVFQRQVAGCGSADLKVRGSGLVGTNVDTEMVNAQGFAFINYSFQTLGLPLASCGCTVAYDLGVLVGSSTSTLPIPNNPTLVGTTVYQQGFDLFDPTTSCVSPVPGIVLSTTDGIQFSIL